MNPAAVDDWHIIGLRTLVLSVCVYWDVVEFGANQIAAMLR